MPKLLIDLIIAAVIVLVLGAIVFYIVREKKRGSKCIGCPYAKTCPKASQGGCGVNHK
ncbi:MAG: FeoB-associated Cys-rich membrane protein [Clostridia bacterium]|nr:FeoB-associated Cys-rich membrane protein [Clostridia bacterium]